MSDRSGSVHQWEKVQSVDGINVGLEYTGPLVGLEGRVSDLARSLSLEEQEFLGVQLFDQTKFVCVLNEAGLTRLQGAFCKIVDAYQDAYRVLFVLAPNHTHIRLIFGCSYCRWAWLNRIEFSGYD